MLQTNVRGPLIIAAIVIGLSLVLGLGGSYFFASKLTTQSRAIANERVAAARAATLGPRIAALKEQEAAAAAYERVIALLLPTQEQLLEVPRSINQLGKAHAVDAQFQFMGSPEAGQAKPGSSLPFSLSVTGQPANLVDFLEDFEVKNPRYTIHINTSELSLVNEAEGGKLTLEGSFYYQ